MTAEVVEHNTIVFYVLILILISKFVLFIPHFLVFLHLLCSRSSFSSLSSTIFFLYFPCYGFYL